MAISKDSLSQIPTCYATVSIGTPQTPLEEKLEAIASANWQGIELGFPDLLSFSARNAGRQVGPQDFDTLCDAGLQIKRLCAEKKLQIVMLQPFSNFEGWQQGSEEREDAFRRAKGWIRIMQAVGTDMLQVGSSDSPQVSQTPRSSIIADLTTLADLLAPHKFKLAYENWCWSTHAPDWKDVWAIVKAINRPNVGLCLDTFQSAGGEYGDPSTPSGLIESLSPQALKERFCKSMADLGTTIPGEKIFILQISDGYRVHFPAETKDENGKIMPPRAQWSVASRPVPYDGGYLPVEEVTKAVLKTGFRGWFSMEVFDGGPPGGEAESKEWKDLGGYTRKAMRSHERLLREVADD